jgi:hypothetical protein
MQRFPLFSDVNLNSSEPNLLCFVKDKLMTGEMLLVNERLRGSLKHVHRDTKSKLVAKNNIKNLEMTCARIVGSVNDAIFLLGCQIEMKETVEDTTMRVLRRMLGERPLEEHEIKTLETQEKSVRTILGKEITTTRVYHVRKLRKDFV